MLSVKVDGSSIVLGGEIKDMVVPGVVWSEGGKIVFRLGDRRVVGPGRTRVPCHDAALSLAADIRAICRREGINVTDTR